MPDTATPPAAPPATPAPATPPAPPAQPGAGEQLLAGKFKTVADLEAGYLAAQQLIGSRQPQVPGGDSLKITPPADAAAAGGDAQTKSIVDRAGLKMDDLMAQFTQHGDLTPEQYQAFGRAGVAKADVRDYIDGRVAKQTLQQKLEADVRAQALQKVGGEEQLGTLLTWAKGNLKPEEAQWYDQQASNPRTALQGFEWLMARHRDAVGAGGAAPIVGGGAPAGGAAGFASQAELMAAMNDKRFDTDTDYQRQVTARLAATKADLVGSL